MFNVPEVTWSDSQPVVFPLHDRYVRHNSTLEGIEEAKGISTPNFDVPKTESAADVGGQPPAPQEQFQGQGPPVLDELSAGDEADGPELLDGDLLSEAARAQFPDLFSDTVVKPDDAPNEVPAEVPPPPVAPPSLGEVVAKTEPVPAVRRDVGGHRLGPDGFRIRKGSNRPLGWHPRDWNSLGVAGRAHILDLIAKKGGRKGG